VGKIRLVACAALLQAHLALAEQTNVELLPIADAAAMREAADRLARCAGTYRGAAAVMRENGRGQKAAYAESVGFGALFAAYLLLTSQSAVDAKILGALDPNVHIETLAWASERNFVMQNEQAEPAALAAFKACRDTEVLQSRLLRGALPALAGKGTDLFSAPFGGGN
jgi:hypothetical protein